MFVCFFMWTDETNASIPKTADLKLAFGLLNGVLEKRLAISIVHVPHHNPLRLIIRQAIQNNLNIRTLCMLCMHLFF